MGEFGGLAHADEGGDIFGAAAAIVFLGAAALPGLPASAAADVEGAGAFGAVEFVGGDREEVEGEVTEVEGDFAGGLDCVNMEGDVVFSAEFAECANVKEGAGFVVGPHDAGECDIGILEGEFEGVEAEAAVKVDGDFDDAVALFGEGLDGFADGGVFDTTDNESFAGGAHGEEAVECGVVRFCASAGEEDFLGIASEQLRDLKARLFDGLAGFLAEAVGAAGIAVAIGEEGEHGVADGWVELGGGVVVEIDHSPRL